MLPSERTVYELPQKLCRLHGHYVGTVPNRNSHPLARSLIFIPNSAVVCPREADVAVEIRDERAIERDGQDLYKFAEFTLDVPERRLTRGALRVHLARKPTTYESH